MNIEDLKPGRELDALVAEKVMGWPTFEQYNNDRVLELKMANAKGRRDNEVVPHYSTDIASAWEVVEKLYAIDPHEPTLLQIYGPLSDGYKINLIWEHHDGPILIGSLVADTAPLGICLAALKAVGYGISQSGDFSS